MDNARVAVLEERLGNFEQLVSRLDSAIEKIAEVNNNVSRMLAVHEERIGKQEKIDAVLFDKINPQSIKILEPLLLGQNDAMIVPTVATIDGSR